VTSSTAGSLGGVSKDPAAQAQPVEVVQSIEQSFSQLFVRVKGSLREAAAMLGPDIQPAAWTVLRWVSRNAPAQAGAIAAGTGMDKSAVSRQLKDLRERGLVSIEHDPADARVVRVTPTAEAIRRMDAVTDMWSRHFREILGGWTEEELQTFALLLERFVAADPWSEPRSSS
jgi:DNA-binding MarR family transcriptional regulator